MIVAFIYGGPEALFLVIILSILEISLSFDNAVINATVLQRMSEFFHSPVCATSSPASRRRKWDLPEPLEPRTATR
ncbi:hypothetical protein ABT116_47850, partial [Streptomyces sp. NPDC002130]